MQLCAQYTIHHAAFNELETKLPNAPYCALPITFSCILPSTLSRTLPIALDGTLLACMTLHSQVSSQDGVKHTPGCALNDAPNCTRWHTSSLLHLCSQVSSQWCSQLHTMAHSLPAGVQHPKYTLSSASNGSKFPVWFRVWSQRGTGPFQWVLPHWNPDLCTWGAFTTKNLAFQPHIVGSD